MGSDLLWISISGSTSEKQKGTVLFNPSTLQIKSNENWPPDLEDLFV